MHIYANKHTEKLRVKILPISFKSSLHKNLQYFLLNFNLQKKAMFLSNLFRDKLLFFWFSDIGRTISGKASWRRVIVPKNWIEKLENFFFSWRKLYGAWVLPCCAWPWNMQGTPKAKEHGTLNVKSKFILLFFLGKSCKKLSPWSALQVGGKS